MALCNEASMAKESGFKTYTSKSPCKNCLNRIRYSSNACCVVCNDKYNGLKRNWQSKDLNKRQLQLFKSVKNRAKHKGIPFSLSFEEIIWPEKCPVFDFTLNYFPTTKERDFGPSFDRSDSSEGYTPSNVIIMSFKANRLKSNATAIELEIVLKYLQKLG